MKFILSIPNFRKAEFEISNPTTIKCLQPWANWFTVIQFQRLSVMQPDLQQSTACCIKVKEIRFNKVTGNFYTENFLITLFPPFSVIIPNKIIYDVLYTGYIETTIYIRKYAELE